jgi:class 3 adenylate cyclase
LSEGTIAPAAAVSERKYVTVLISDLSGFTALSGQLDPEELNELMGAIFGAISKIIAAYEGFIEKFMGDAVVAFFGVPAAHEDDPVRAILAAREIHRIIASLHLEVKGKKIPSIHALGHQLRPGGGCRSQPGKRRLRHLGRYHQLCLTA